MSASCDHRSNSLLRCWAEANTARDVCAAWCWAHSAECRDIITLTVSSTWGGVVMACEWMSSTSKHSNNAKQYRVVKISIIDGVKWSGGQFVDLILHHCLCEESELNRRLHFKWIYIFMWSCLCQPPPRIITKLTTSSPFSKNGPINQGPRFAVDFKMLILVSHI